MKRNIYELSNYISWNEEEFDNIKDDLSELDKEKIKKNLKRKVWRYNMMKFKVGAASIAVIAVTGTLLVQPAWAKNIIQHIPILNDAVYEKVGYKEEYKDFSQYVGMSRNFRGYKFTIDKLAGDNSTLIAAIKVQKPGMNKGFQNEKFRGTPNKFHIGVTIPSKVGNNGGDINSTGTIVDDNTSAWTVKTNISYIKKIPKKFKMSIDIIPEDSRMDKDVLKLNLNISTEKFSKEIYELKNLGQYTLGQRKISVNKIKVSPISTCMQCKFSGPSIGNVNYNYFAYDDKGRTYAAESGMVDGETVTEEFNGIKPRAKKLFIVPYYEKEISYEEQQKSMQGLTQQFYSIDEKKEFNYKNEGKINVYNIKKSKDSIKIYYTVKGKIPGMQYIPYVLLYQNDNNKPKCVSFSNVVLSVLDLKNLNDFCIEFTKIDTTKESKYAFPLFINNEIVKGQTIQVNLK